MLATEQTTLTNSLWRELLDYLPVPALLFRIGENDQAQLIFANQEIGNVLGYTPGEYVLESESDGRIQQELNELVDRIASLSHEAGQSGNSAESQDCTLTSNTGNQITCPFSYRIFLSKTAKNHFIVVSLHSAGSVSVNKIAPGKNVTDDDFIAGSDVMKGAMNKAGFISAQPVHGWVMGEPGTGRSTVARRICRMIEARAKSVTVIQCTGDKRPEPSEWQINPGSRVAIVLVDDAGSLQKADFENIKRKTDTWTADGISVKVIATAGVSPESLHETNRLPDSWIYGMTFSTLLLPPLRQRGRDIPEIARSFTKKISELLGVSEPVWDAAAEEQLRRHTWPGNITELKTRTGRAALTGKGRAVRLILDNEVREVIKTGRPETAGEEQFEIIPFDEMGARYLRQVLKQTGGKIYGKDGAAALLKLKPTTLQSKLIRLGIR